MRCIWCHNPESQVCYPELTTKSVIVNEKKFETSETTGQWMTVEDVLKTVEKDSIFYDESKGGVTVSGGEPLFQIDFIEELINSLKLKGFHVTVDTSGYAPESSFKRIADNTDLFLYDIKLIDKDEHIQNTGVSNDIILSNLMWLAGEGKKIVLRFPVIPGITDTRKNIAGLTGLLLQLKEQIAEIDLLPYHSMASHKYKRLDKDYRLGQLKDVTPEELTVLQKEIEKTGFKVKIGG